MSDEALIEKAKAVIEEMRELLAKLQAERDAKPARNWPEKIEPGMVFQRGEETYIASFHNLVCVASTGKDEYAIGAPWAASSFFGNAKSEFTYIGHARDVLTIRTEKAEAHEPTGAELVAPQCEFSTDGITWERGGRCMAYDANLHLYLSEKTGWRNHARFAR